MKFRIILTLPKELKDELIKNSSVPDGTVVIKFNDGQVKSAGSGIQLPLLWHVTLRVCLSAEVSFSQINVKTELSRVELL